METMTAVDCDEAIEIDGTLHECWEPKGHEGAHRCVACSEQF